MPGGYWQRSIYRLNKTDNIKSFINVRSAGHYITHHDFKDIGGKKDFLELFWCHSGEGTLINNGKKIKITTGDVFFYLPGSVHTIYSDNSGWDYYWFTCDGPNLDDIIKTFDIKQEVIHAGECPITIFTTMLEALKKIDISSSLHASIAAYEILLRAINPQLNSNSTHKISEKFKELVSNNYSNSTFSLQEAAKNMNVHRSTLHRVFTSQSGLSPQEYLTTYRLQEAVKLLYSDMTIKEIAKECGFNTQHYFTKIFRKYIGRTPSEFRKTMDEQRFFDNKITNKI